MKIALASKQRNRQDSYFQVERKSIYMSFYPLPGY
jgi:hypothetical protein